MSTVTTLKEPAVRSVMSRGRVGRDQAADIVMDAAVKLARLRPLVRNSEALLVKTALNELIGMRRREARRPWRLIVMDNVERAEADDVAAGRAWAAKECDVADEVAEAELSSMQNGQLREALGTLSANDKYVLKAFYFDGRSPAAMDKERGDRPGTAKLHLHRARERLRKAMRSAPSWLGRAR